MRRLLILLIVLIAAGAASLVWLRLHDSAVSVEDGGAKSAVPIIEKQAAIILTRRFDPANPPADMPPLHAGEQAQCESDFMSHALVSGERRRTGMTSSAPTVTGVKIILQLAITIWVPDGVTQKVLEHEEGHRQIAESYYASADKIAARVASSYIGREITASGDDLDRRANDALQKIGGEITAEYIKQLDPNAAQLRYDDITDHARNDVPVKDAIAQALHE